MSGLAVLGFAILASCAVWESTPKRFGTLDEARALAASIAALLIAAGAWRIIQ